MAPIAAERIPLLRNRELYNELIHFPNTEKGDDVEITGSIEGSSAEERNETELLNVKEEIVERSLSMEHIPETNIRANDNLMKKLKEEFD
ncbi:MAG: hypothetical protein M1821_006566 [Bathelium mastoideum]|nr:MAG: hypothetical protein M1821_006566 [Bathelium mastoideum]